MMIYDKNQQEFKVKDTATRKYYYWKVEIDIKSSGKSLWWK